MDMKRYETLSFYADHPLVTEEEFHLLVFPSIRNAVWAAEYVDREGKLALTVSAAVARPGSLGLTYAEFLGYAISPRACMGNQCSKIYARNVDV